MEDAKEAMELMADGTSIDGIDVCRPTHEVSKNTDLQDLSGERTMAGMSKAVLEAADKGKMTVLQPEIIILQDIRPTHTKKTIELWVYYKWIAKIYNRIEPIANDSFPQPYNFAAYNEVQSKADVKDATLTEQSLMTIPPCQPSHASATARKELFLDTDATKKKPRQEP
nr:hypothetical protein [Tanacetum cinerariifolium]